MALQIYMLFCVTILGAVVGSFLNVCIYRLPWGKSILWPASHCPKCLRPVRAYDNIPVLSYLVLRGRCRDCGERFSPRYMLIEGFTAAVFGFVFWLQIVRVPVAAPNHWVYACRMVLVAALIVSTFIDLDLQIIPDSVTVPGMLAGLAAATLVPGVTVHAISNPAPDPSWPVPGDRLAVEFMLLLGWSLWIASVVWQFRRTDGPVGAAEIVLLGAALLYLAGQTAVLFGLPSDRPWPGWIPWLGAHPHWEGLSTSVVGMLVGAGLVWFVRVVGSAALGKEAMGFGDVTLMGMVGAYLGWQPTVVVFFIAPFLGLVVGVAQWVLRGTKLIPYGPYLSLATLIVLLMWGPIWARVQGHFAILAQIPVLPVVLILLAIFIVCLVRNRR